MDEELKAGAGSIMFYRIANEGFMNPHNPQLTRAVAECMLCEDLFIHIQDSPKFLEYV